MTAGPVVHRIRYRRVSRLEVVAWCSCGWSFGPRIEHEAVPEARAHRDAYGSDASAPTLNAAVGALRMCGVTLELTDNTSGPPIRLAPLPGAPRIGGKTPVPAWCLDVVNRHAPELVHRLRVERALDGHARRTGQA